MDNFYHSLENIATDVNLMFIVQSKKIDSIIYNVMYKLNIAGDGDGLPYLPF